MKDKQGLFGKICKTVKSQRKKIKLKFPNHQLNQLFHRFSVPERRLSIWRLWRGQRSRCRLFPTSVLGLLQWRGEEGGGGWSVPKTLRSLHKQQWWSGQSDEAVVMARPQFITEPLTLMVNEGDVIRGTRMTMISSDDNGKGRLRRSSFEVLVGGDGVQSRF